MEVKVGVLLKGLWTEWVMFRCERNVMMVISLFPIIRI